MCARARNPGVIGVENPSSKATALMITTTRYYYNFIIRYNIENNNLQPCLREHHRNNIGPWRTSSARYRNDMTFSEKEIWKLSTDRFAALALFPSTFNNYPAFRLPIHHGGICLQFFFLFSIKPHVNKPRIIAMLKRPTATLTSVVDIFELDRNRFFNILPYHCYTNI